jgi:hypothetical protein
VKRNFGISTNPPEGVCHGRKPKDDLSFDLVSDLLSYDPETGIFKWKQTRCGKAKAGGVAGKTKRSGYRSIMINGRAYFAHRLAWLLTTGRWPAADIDHIDGNPSNNRFFNLREATRSQNNWNTKRVGVTKTPRGKFKSRIYVNNVAIALGDHPTFELARAAYLAAKEKYHGEFSPRDVEK